MSRNNTPPGRGLRRPKRKVQDPEAVQRFIDDADKRAAMPAVTNIQDISDIRQAQDKRAEKKTQTQQTAADKTAVVKRADGRTLKRTTVYLKPELHQRLKVAGRLSAQDGSAIINTLLETHLEGIIANALKDLS